MWPDGEGHLHKMPSYETQGKRAKLYLTAGAVYKSRECWGQLNGRASLAQVRPWVLPLHQDKMESQPTSSWKRENPSTFLTQSFFSSLCPHPHAGLTDYRKLQDLSRPVTARWQHHRSHSTPRPPKSLVLEYVRTGHSLFHPSDTNTFIS